MLLETKDGGVLYRGFLTDFWLDKDGGIRELHFEKVRRRVFKNDVETGNANLTINEEMDEAEPTEQEISDVDERYYYIPGEHFIIKY